MKIYIAKLKNNFGAKYIKSNIIEELANNLFVKIEYGDIIDKYIEEDFIKEIH